MVLPVLPEVPLPSVEALLVSVEDGAGAALLPIEPLLPEVPLLFFRSLPEEPPVVEPLPMLLLLVEPLPRLLPVEPLPKLLPVEPLPVELPPVLLPGMFLFVSTMMISFKKS